MATDGGGELQASVGGLLLARDDGDVLPTPFKVGFISPLFSSLKNYEQAIIHLFNILDIIISH